MKYLLCWLTVYSFNALFIINYFMHLYQVYRVNYTCNITAARKDCVVSLWQSRDRVMTRRLYRTRRRFSSANSKTLCRKNFQKETRRRGVWQWHESQVHNDSVCLSVRHNHTETLLNVSISRIAVFKHEHDLRHGVVVCCVVVRCQSISLCSLSMIPAPQP